MILPTYPERIAALKREGAELQVIFGIGRVFHIAFWEPHFAAEFAERRGMEAPDSPAGREAAPAHHRAERHHQFQEPHDAGAGLRQHHRPGAFPAIADRIIGGADGSLGRGMMWQGMSLWVTLRYGPNRWVPSSFMPTLPGRLFFLQELAGPLVAECN